MKVTSKKKRNSRKGRTVTCKTTALAMRDSQGGSSVPATLSLANPGDVMGFSKVLKNYIVQNDLSVKIEGKDYAKVDAWKFAGLNFGLTAIPEEPQTRHIIGQYITILYVEKEFHKGNDRWKKEVPVFVGYTQHKDIIEEILQDGSVFQKVNGNVVRTLTKPYFAYACGCKIVRIVDKSEVSYGQGFCSNMEVMKVGQEEYAINSQSQTRSIGKGYRNLLGFVMNAAGYETTPFEEMEEVERERKERQTTQPKAPGKKHLNDKGEDSGFAKLLARVIKGDKHESGESLVTMAIKTFDLTESQVYALRAAEKSAQQNQNT